MRAALLKGARDVARGVIEHFVRGHATDKLVGASLLLTCVEHESLIVTYLYESGHNDT